MKTFLQSLRLLAGLTLLTGALYPLAVWAAGQLLFHDTANGSLQTRRGVLVGSALLAQKTTDPRYFSPRPSAGDYAAVASGASNLAWTSTKLRDTVAANEKQFREQNLVPDSTVLPADAITASGSGLDPDLTLATVKLQAHRVAAARRLTSEQQDALDGLIARHVEGGQLGEARINILRLNLALDETFPPK